MALKLVKRGLTGGDSESRPPKKHWDPIKIDIGGEIFDIFMNEQKRTKFGDEYSRLYNGRLREVFLELGVDQKEYEDLLQKLWRTATGHKRKLVPAYYTPDKVKLRQLQKLKIKELDATWTPWCTFLDESNLEPLTVDVRFRRLDSGYNAFNSSMGKAEERAKEFTNTKHFYVYRDDLYSFDSLDGNTEEEQKLLIKQYYFKKEKQFERLRKEIRLFEKLEAMEVQESREPIPEDVRFAVWRRDGGKCVRCGSNKNLEFDHIIPFSKGGSNTERNIQLLCEKCNREKSDKI